MNTEFKKEIIMDQTAINIVTDTATTTLTPMDWPQALATVGVAFAIAFIVYAMGR